MVLSLTTLVLVVSIQIPVYVAAENAAHPSLAQAQQLHDDFEYERMLQVLELLLQDESLSVEDRSAALLLQGRGLVASGCDGAALATYHALLELDPTYSMPTGESPKVRECFALALKTRPASAPSSVPSARDGTPSGIRAAGPGTSQTTLPSATTTPLPDPEQKEGWLGSWWFWAVGAAAVGAGVATVTIWILAQSAPLSDGNLGKRVTLEPIP